MSAVNHLMALRHMEVLKKACIDDVPDQLDVKGSTKANVVALRRDTSGSRISVVVMHFDPVKKDGWSNSVGSRHAIADDLDYPPEDSGGIFERVHGVVMVTANLASTGEDQVEADYIVQEIIARARRALVDNMKSFAGIKDTYGNVVQHFKVVGDAEYDSGADSSNKTVAFIRWVAIVRIPYVIVLNRWPSGRPRTRSVWYEPGCTQPAVASFSARRWVIPSP